MARQSKAAKKYAKRLAKTDIKKKKIAKKIQRQKEEKEKKLIETPIEASDEEDLYPERAARKQQGGDSDDDLGNVDTEEYFEKGFKDKINAKLDGDDDDDDAEIEFESDEDAISASNDGENASESDDSSDMESVDDKEDNSSEEGGDDLEEDDEDPDEAVKRHQRELDELKKVDPEFYGFLKQEEQDLLNFKETSTKQIAKHSLSRVVTSSWVDYFLKKAKTNDVSALKKLLAAFKLACQFGESERRDKRVLIIPSVDESGKVISKCLDNLPALLCRHIGRKQDDTHVPHKNNKWSKFEFYVRSFLASSIHLLEKSTDVDTLSFVMKSIEPLIPCFGHFLPLARKLLKQLLQHMCNQNELVRFRAFVLVRKLALLLPFPFLDLCLKGVYLTFVRTCKFYKPARLSVIEFLMNAVVELYGLDIQSSYQHAFVYIRQLALYLRMAISPPEESGSRNNANPEKKKKKETDMTSIYNWRFIHSLRCWSKVLCAYPDKETGLGSLIYPLTQITLGILQIPQTSLRYLPLRYHCVSILNHISKHTGVFIPVIQYLLDILEEPEVQKIPKASAKQPIDFIFSLRVAPYDFNTKDLRDIALRESLYYLLESLAIHANSIAFPELAFPALKALRSYKKNKTIKHPYYEKKLQAIIQKIEETNQFIFHKRSAVEFAPSDIQKASNFISKDQSTPISRYYDSEKAARDKLIKVTIQAMIDSSSFKKQADEEEEGDENDDGEDIFADDDDESASAAGNGDEDTATAGEKEDNEAVEEEEEAEKNTAAKDSSDKKKRKRGEDDEDDEVGTEQSSSSSSKKETKQKKKKKSKGRDAIAAEDIVEDLQLSDSDDE